MREVGYKLRLREVLFNCFLHCPVNLFNLAVGSNGIHCAEHLRNIHHIAGVEEGNLFVPPLFAVVAAHILRAVFRKGFKQYLLFNLYHFTVALIGDIHKRTLALNAYYLLYKRSGFRLVVKAHNRGLELLQQLARCLESARHILEQESAETALLRLVENSYLSLCYNTESTLGAYEYLV